MIMYEGISERIEVDPKIHFGKPCLKNTRIPVSAILELIREGIPFKNIRNQYYPEIEIDDIKACIDYAQALIEEEEISILGYSR